MRGYLVAGLLLFCAGAGEAAADNYGAIAYSPSTKVYAWSYDYSKRVTIGGLPILPSLGVKGAF